MGMNSSKQTSTLQEKFRNGITWSWNNGNNCGIRLGFQRAQALIEKGIKHACQQLIMKLGDIHMGSRRDVREATRSDADVGSEQTFDAEILLSISVMPDSHSAWTQNIGHQCSKFIREKATSYIRDIDSVENSGILEGRLNGEVIALVEFVMRNVKEEFERSLVSQGVLIKNQSHGLREVVGREDKSVARMNQLEALAVDNAEEIKFLSQQWQKIKVEKMAVEEKRNAKEQGRIRLIKEGEERGAVIEELKEELQTINRTNQEQVQHLEYRKGEIELQLQEIINNMGHLLIHSKRDDADLEAISGTELENLRLLNFCFRKFLSGHVLETDSQLTKEEIAILEEQLQRLTNAVTAYPEALEQNRKLFKEVQDLKGNIRVYCRIRPFPSDESEHNKHSTIEQNGKNGELLMVYPNKEGKDARRMFHFTKVFGISASQEEVYVDTQPLIRSVLDGYNVCIFAYGQTGSGKTFTMTGPESSMEKDKGVNYRALNDIFQISQERRNSFAYEIGIQMIEIYNEQVRDLLGSQKSLGIRNISQPNGVSVPDATMLPVQSTKQVLRLMKQGEKNRSVGATKLNEHSSRSHSVLTVHVEGKDLSSEAIFRGRLHLVDLAGSERIDRSKVTGVRLREAQKINKSLSALGDVIYALANKSAHVPYRNSKLTQILQDSLGGQAKTLMFVQVNPNIEFFWDTVSTLKFAERVSSVEMGAAQSNKESKEVRELKEQFAKLTSVASKKDSEIDRLKRL